tara:strand:+ start:910 stop:1788 length:879 start_codon:yes stop_codon:yes gene_type:complete
MNENENGELFIPDLIYIDVGGDDGTTDPDPSNMTATFVGDMSPEQQETFWKITSTLPTAYNYMTNFKNMNIDNEIFYIKKLVDYDNPSATDQTTQSPYKYGPHTDGGKYLKLFKVLNTRTATGNFISRNPVPLDYDAAGITKSDMTIARHVHYLGDIKFGDREFPDRDDEAFSVYFPSMRDYAEEVVYSLIEESGLEFVRAALSKKEIQGLANKFGSIPGGAKNHIENKFEEFTTDLFDTFISRENIPNIITNNSKLFEMDDLRDEGASGISVSAEAITITDTDASEPSSGY